MYRVGGKWLLTSWSSSWFCVWNGFDWTGSPSFCLWSRVRDRRQEVSGPNQGVTGWDDSRLCQVLGWHLDLLIKLTVWSASLSMVMSVMLMLVHDLFYWLNTCWCNDCNDFFCLCLPVCQSVLRMQWHRQWQHLDDTGCLLPPQTTSTSKRPHHRLIKYEGLKNWSRLPMETLKPKLCVSTGGGTSQVPSLSSQTNIRVSVQRIKAIFMLWFFYIVIPYPSVSCKDRKRNTSVSGQSLVHSVFSPVYTSLTSLHSSSHSFLAFWWWRTFYDQSSSFLLLLVLREEERGGGKEKRSRRENEEGREWKTDEETTENDFKKTSLLLCRTSTSFIFLSYILLFD